MERSVVKVCVCTWRGSDANLYNTESINIPSWVSEELTRPQPHEELYKQVDLRLLYPFNRKQILYF